MYVYPYKCALKLAHTSKLYLVRVFVCAVKLSLFCHHKRLNAATLYCTFIYSFICIIFYVFKFTFSMSYLYSHIHMYTHSQLFRIYLYLYLYFLIRQYFSGNLYAFILYVPPYFLSRISLFSNGKRFYIRAKKIK